MVAGSNTLDELRQAVLGNNRGRSVEVKPTGEILLADEEVGTDQNVPDTPQPKVSKMSKTTFGT